MENFLKNISLFASGTAQTITTGSILAAIVGAVYIVDCRITAGADHDKANSCYIVGLPIMGIGVAGRTGFNAGYNTLNPLLKRPEDEEKTEKPATKTTSRTRAPRTSKSRN
jgi:hypothetical protein